MLTTQARLAMKNKQPVRLVGDLYNILEIKHVNGTRKMVATIKKVAWMSMDINQLMLMSII